MPNLQTRIKLKYDTLENWQLVADTFTPLAGEVCICEVPTGASEDGIATPPATICKVGDGTSTWANLPWMSASAADVYPWAKSPTPPATVVTVNDTESATWQITDITASGNTITVDRTDKSNSFAVTGANKITGITIGPDGVITAINEAPDIDTNTDTDTTYTLTSPTAGRLTLTPSDGEPQDVPINGWGTIATAQQCASAAYTLAQAANTLAASANALATTANNTASTAVQTATNSGTGVVLGIAKSETTITATRGLVNESLVSTTISANLSAASTALQPSDITTGTDNGTISVNGEDILVKGLGSAAYTASTAYEAAGAVSNHNTSGTAHADIRSLITGLTEKVNGRTTAYVYQNKSDPDYTAAIAKAGSFIIGDTIYFLDSEIPDEWVTAVNASSPFYTFQEIETESPNLSGYVTGTNLTANKIVLGNAGSAVQTSDYGISTTVTAEDNNNVPTSGAVATYVDGRGYQTEQQVSSAIESAIDGLDATTTGAGAANTLSALSETNGVISATFTPIIIPTGQVSGLQTALDGKQAAHNALTNLSSIMVNSTEGTGFIKKTGPNTYDIDPATYLTSASLSGYATQSWVTDQEYQNASQVNNLINTAVSSGSIKEALDDKQPIDADLTAIAGLTGTSGLLRKTKADTWSLDTNTYVTTSQLTTNLSTKFDTVTASGNAGVVTAVTDGGGTAITVTQANLYTANPTASGSATAFIDTISQAANGKITVTKKNVTFPTPITPGNGALQDGTGATIFTANQSTNTQILVIDCGTASTVVYDVD